jgi:Flagellar FliJ protein
MAEIQAIERAWLGPDAATGPAAAGQYAVIDWCALHAAAALKAARERLHRCIPAWEAARNALCTARLERRVLEKLEERYERAKRLRRARRESADIDEGNMLVRLR